MCFISRTVKIPQKAYLTAKLKILLECLIIKSSFDFIYSPNSIIIS